MKSTWRLLGLFLLVSLLLTPVSARAQDSSNEYFPETGHNVKGEFWVFYNKATNPTAIYGYPLTEEFTSKDGKTVQYFQRARFELDTNLPAGQQVRLTDLGKETYVPGGLLNVYSPTACRTFGDNKYPVCYAFLEFFEKNGGIAQFGYPVSTFEYHDDLIVQYFEKVRMEWRPWMSEGQRVAVADLGRAYFDRVGEDPVRLDPAPPLDNRPLSPLAIDVRAFVWKAVTLSTDQQLVFIIAQDQNGRPINNATGKAIVHWPSGAKEEISFATNSNGIGILPLSFSDQPYGTLVYMDVEAAYSGLKGSTTISFRIWY
jgi:hypothetical protein